MEERPLLDDRQRPRARVAAPVALFALCAVGAVALRERGRRSMGEPVNKQTNSHASFKPNNLRVIYIEHAEH